MSVQPAGQGWTVRHDQDAGGECVQILDAERNIIAALHYIAFNDPARNEANRVLVEQRANEIVRAVNARGPLVEALEKIAEQFCDSDECFASADARTALAQALGEAAGLATRSEEGS